ncbi:hypothetical protein ADICYQ_0995 [Cyclobacterium qasimii M12-11B]|uniref:Uncharacterized protein n=1 Tax=Cyclobacterium qasimii M12-11B TaxID=641524 RepID=S7VKU8_9BACT|nr:hypothetical protein ADICYQ_0995 [Cyclobacterium qasimii M12-11B]
MLHGLHFLIQLLQLQNLPLINFDYQMKAIDSFYSINLKPECLTSKSGF